jgi:hypothetical protein
VLLRLSVDLPSSSSLDLSELRLSFPSSRQTLFRREIDSRDGNAIDFVLRIQPTGNNLATPQAELHCER